MPPTRPPGRRKPYTEIGIRRRPCARCGRRPSAYQWNSCALDNRWFPLCPQCDVDLNWVVLCFMRVPGKRAVMARYVERVRTGGKTPRHRPR